jgi:hypothetical protein
MKKLTNIAISLALPAIAISGLVWATPPEPAEIIHCGCAEDGSVLELVTLDITDKGIHGHNKHVYLQWETCSTAGAPNNFQRDRSDCFVSGTNNGLRTCSGDDFTAQDCD